MLLHVLWLQPSDVCAVSDWSFARWFTFFCWLFFLHVVPHMLQGFAFLPSVSLPNKRFVVDPSIPTAQNDEKNICDLPVLIGMTIFRKQVSMLFFFKTPETEDAHFFSQFYLVMSNFWNIAAVFWFLSRTLLCEFCCRDLKDSFTPPRNGLASCNFHFGYVCSICKSAFEFPLSVNGKYEERNSWILDKMF